MSWKYYTSLLVYSIVKISSVITWISLIDEEIINSPLAFKDFIKPSYAILTIVLLLLLPKMRSSSRTTTMTVVLLIAGLLLTNLYLVVDSLFPLQPKDYQLHGWLVSSTIGLIFCTAMVTLIYESLKSVKLFCQ